jgi:hypothetical protein
MASAGRERLGEHYEQDHLTYEEIEGIRPDLGFRGSQGQNLPHGRPGREPNGNVVKSTESTGTSAVLCYRQAAS